eukprot:XP_001703974.1 Hypothetical protein GL50803_27724 [Giardia lamblia ATCC 50803]
MSYGPPAAELELVHRPHELHVLSCHPFLQSCPRFSPPPQDEPAREGDGRYDEKGDNDCHGDRRGAGAGLPGLRDACVTPEGVPLHAYAERAD